MRLPRDTNSGRSGFSIVSHFSPPSWNSGKESFATVGIRDASSVSTVRLGNVSPSELCHRKGVLAVRSTEGMNTFNFLVISKICLNIQNFKCFIMFSILCACAKRVAKLNNKISQSQEKKIEQNSLSCEYARGRADGQNWAQSAAEKVRFLKQFLNMMWVVIGLKSLNFGGKKNPNIIELLYPKIS